MDISKLKTRLQLLIKRARGSKVFKLNTFAAILFAAQANFTQLSVSLPPVFYGYVGFGLSIAVVIIKLIQYNGEIVDKDKTP